MTTPEYRRGLGREEVRRDFLSVMDRLVRHFTARSTDQAGQHWHEPVDNYGDPELFSEEVRLVHRRVPLPLALSCELPGPGSHKAITVLGTPVLITRDVGGSMHALVNACRHRGTELLGEGHGRAAKLVCPQHGWSYNLSGRLCGIPGEQTFGPVDRAEHSLIRLPVEERHGIVFVGLTPGVALELDSWLGEAGPALAALRLGACHHHSTRLLAGPNWKLVVDGYLEGYHFASLHRTTVFRTNMSNMAVLDRWGPHGRVSFALRAIAEAVGTPREDWDPAMYVGPILWLFPTLAIAGGLRHQLAVSLVLPGDSVAKSVTHQLLLLRERPADDEAVKNADQARDWFHDVVLDEDYATAEGVQRGLAALSGTEFVFGRNEPGVHHFHRTLTKMLS